MMLPPIAVRLAALMLYVPDLTLEELDDLAERPRGHSSQIRRGKKRNPRPETVSSIATVLGARPAFLTYGDGDAPTGDAVRAAVDKARAKRDGVHASAPVRARG